MQNTMTRRRSLVWLASRRVCPLANRLVNPLASRRVYPGGWVVLVALGLTLAGAMPARAQAPKAKAPAAKAPAAPAAGKDVDVPPAPLGEDDPAVRAVLESKPTTPAQCARAAKILADLQRPDLAKILVKKILDAKPSEQQLAELANQFGPSLFLDLASVPELCPEARQLADAVTAANNRQLQDPKRLAGLLKQLQDPAEDVRAQAMASLQDAGGAGVEALVGALGGGGRDADHAAARAALVEIGRDAAGPMLAVVAGAGADMKVQAIEVLAALHATDALPSLLAPALAAGSDPRVRAAAAAVLAKAWGRTPNQEEAVQMLLKQAALYLHEKQPLRGESGGRILLWYWDEDKGQCAAASYTVGDASRVLAARLARDAMAIAPQQRQVRQLYLATMLEEAVDRRGLAKGLDAARDPVAREAARLGAAEVNDALQYALDARLTGACIGAAEVLGHYGKAQEALRTGARPAPLLLAACDPDRRVRMAALEAIVRLQPAAPLAGSSRVLEQLCFLAATSGARRALIAGPNVTALRELAEMLSAAGYRTDMAATGREALRMATASPDYEVAFIDTTIDDPPVELLVQELRHDGRTAGLRIGLLARWGRLAQAQRVAGEDPLCLAFSRPRDPEAVRWQLQQLAALAPREFVAFPERQSQAVRAMRCLAALAATSGKLYDIYRAQDVVLAALYVPKLSVPACEVLAHLGTPAAQRTLVDLASRFTQPIAARRAAAAAFRLNTEKFGVLLAAAEVRRQYDRYKQSGHQDAATQGVLSSLLDSLEAPAQSLKAKAPAPPAPPAPLQKAPK